MDDDFLTPEQLAAEVLRESRSAHGDRALHIDDPNPSTDWTPEDVLGGTVSFL